MVMIRAAKVIQNLLNAKKCKKILLFSAKALPLRLK
jgi:hypothetical protein